MEAFLIYLLKSAGVVALFVCCYYVFLRKETFFVQNRIFLITGPILSLIIPLFSYTKTIWVNVTPSYSSDLMEQLANATSQTSSFDWYLLFFTIYGTGVIVLFARLLLQLLSLRKLITESNVVKKEGFCFVETNRDTAPFSFFNYIVYNPKHYSKIELEAILTHEKIHAKALHSLDIICVHLITIFQWCNPFIWWYKICVGQNLEFIADTATLKKNKNKESYQYLMLKTSIGENNFSITNPFFNSLIKKRIVMLNKKQSQKMNLVKYSTILPLLIGFVFLFNIKTVAKTKPLLNSMDTNYRHLQNGDQKTYVITKEFTDTEIDVLAEKIKNENGTLTIKKLKRNKNGHISRIELAFKVNNDGHVSGNYDEKEGIDPIHFGKNLNGGIFITTDKNLIEGKPYYSTDHNEDSKERSVKFIRSYMDSNKTDKEIIITTKNGKEKSHVNGKETTWGELKEMGINIQKNSETEKLEENSSIVIGESRSDGDPESGSNLLKFDINGEKPLIILDGKEVPFITMKKLNPEKIESIHVLKDGKAIEKYGEKAKDGVIEIKTKNPWKVSVGLSPPHPEKTSVTSDYLQNNKINPDLNSPDIHKALIIIDGKESTKQDLDKIMVDKIESMSVFKGNHAKAKYGDKAKDGVIEIILKKKDAPQEVKIRSTTIDQNPLILIDGIESSKDYMKKLDPDSIESINVLKDEKAIQKYGDKGKDGVIEIILKKKDE